MNTRTALTIILSLIAVLALAIVGLIYALMQSRAINFPVLPRTAVAPLPHTPATKESLAPHSCASLAGVPAWRVSSFAPSARHDVDAQPARRFPSCVGHRVSLPPGESNTAAVRTAYAAGELQFPPPTTFAGEPPASAGPVSPRAAVRMFPPRVAGGSSDLSALNSQLSTLRS